MLLQALFCVLIFALGEVSSLLKDQYHNRVIWRNNRMVRRKHKSCIFGMCEEYKNYPEKNVLSIIQRNKVIHSFFGNAIEPFDKISVISRNTGEQPESFCRTVDITVIPKWMEDIDGVNRTLTNVKEFTQAVKFQTCDFSNGESCFASNLLEQETKCLQVFTVVKLLTVDISSDVLEYRRFRIPSTCVCSYV